MQAFVVVATKGRPFETGRLLDYIARQTQPPARIYICGAGPADIDGLENHPLAQAGLVETFISPRAGLTIQRNVAVDRLLATSDIGDGFAVFFDDDFVPASDWLEQCAAYFSSRPDIAAVTGRVLADGVRSSGYGYDDADAYLSSARPPEPHWASGDTLRDLSSVYGCNMAARISVLAQCRFDERLSLYGWQEDRDFTAQAKRFGRTVYAPLCRGVHLGVKGSRISGVKFGYSQVANPLYLLKKGSMSVPETARFVSRALAANVLRTARRQTTLFDYPGRLRGNVMAFADLLRGRCRPERILELS